VNYAVTLIEINRLSNYWKRILILLFCWN